MFVYQIGDSINIMKNGDQPAPFVGDSVTEADVVLGADNFIFPGSDSSFNPFGTSTKVEFKMGGSEIASGSGASVPAATTAAIGGVKQVDKTTAAAITDVAGLVSALTTSGVIEPAGQ